MTLYRSFSAEIHSCLDSMTCPFDLPNDLVLQSDVTTIMRTICQPTLVKMGKQYEISSSKGSLAFSNYETKLDTINGTGQP